MARCDSVLRETAAGERDVGLELGVSLLPRLGARGQQTELFELAREARVDPGSVAQFVQIEICLLRSQAGAPPPLAVARRRRGELLADHAQRENLVTLQPQDRLEPLHVLLAEEPIAALGAPRGKQPLILEVTDLR